MNLQRRTPYRDIKRYQTPLTQCVMASFVSLFLSRDSVREYGLPIGEFFIWSDDWEYTRRISLQKPCYLVVDSRVTHAMKSNAVVNIAKDTPDRVERYRYFYRNDVVLYRREGIRGWLWLLAKDFWHLLQLIQYRQFQRGRYIWKGFIEGISFYPKIEFP